MRLHNIMPNDLVWIVNIEKYQIELRRFVGKPPHSIAIELCWKHALLLCAAEAGYYGRSRGDGAAETCWSERISDAAAQRRAFA